MHKNFNSEEVSVQQSSTENKILFTLPFVMGNEGIDLLCLEFGNFLSRGYRFIILDASGVEVISTSGLQLLVSLEKSLSASGVVLSIRGGSEYFISAVRDAGLENLLKGSEMNG